MDKLKTLDMIQLKFWTDQPVIATVLQLVLLIALTLAVIFCLATIGEFTGKYNEYNKDRDGQEEKVCLIFYGKSGNDHSCQFVIASHVIVVLSLTTMFVLLALLVFLRVHNPIDKIISIILAINSVQMLLLSFITSIVLSAGFAETCKEFTSMTAGQPCSAAYNSIYNSLQSSTALSWMETIFLGVVCVASFLYLGLIAYRRRDNTSSTYETFIS